MSFPKLFIFLEDLKNNNRRDWFHEHKKDYQEALQSVELMVELIIHEIRKFDSSIPALQARDCIFRIYRDIRFSKDKSPYKTHFGAFISPKGRKGNRAGYYFHLEPGNSMAAGGLHQPPSETLRKVRNHIFQNPSIFKALISEKSFTNVFSGIQGEQLKTIPKGFPKDFPEMELLRFKSYTVFASIGDIKLAEQFPENIIRMFKAMYPFIDFLNRAMND